MSEAVRKRPGGLGRGLSALLGETTREQPLSSDASGRSPGVQLVPVASIKPHPAQPRRYFDDGALDELAASIAARGLLQPIVVRPQEQGDGFQIVAGERRWRAAQRARLHEVPVLIRQLNDAETLEIALVENIQREDLNAIEEAEGYKRLAGEFGHTQEALGRLVNKSRSHIANLLRLLELPEPVRQSVASGALSMGHARALITARDPETLADDVVRRGLSVRETEQLARAAKPKADGEAGPGQARKAGQGGRNEDVVALERQVSDLLGLKVSIQHDGQGGMLTLHYSTLDQLDMVCQRLSGEPI